MPKRRRDRNLLGTARKKQMRSGRAKSRYMHIAPTPVRRWPGMHKPMNVRRRNPNHMK